MEIDKLREILRERLRIHEETLDEWTDGIYECWKKEVDILSVDVDGMIDFFKNECTGEEYSLLSEVFENLAEKNI